MVLGLLLKITTFNTLPRSTNFRSSFNLTLLPSSPTFLLPSLTSHFHSHPYLFFFLNLALLQLPSSSTALFNYNCRKLFYMSQSLHDHLSWFKLVYIQDHSDLHLVSSSRTYPLCLLMFSSHLYLVVLCSSIPTQSSGINPISYYQPFFPSVSIF